MAPKSNFFTELKVGFCNLLKQNFKKTRKSIVKIGFFTILFGSSFLTISNSFAGEKQPMAVLCPSGLNFYTVCGGDGGGCVATKCDESGNT